MPKTNEGFPLNLPPSEGLTWDDVRVHIVARVGGEPNETGPSKANEAPADTPVTRATTWDQDSADQATNPVTTRVSEVWEDILDGEFPPFLPLSEGVSLDEVDDEDHAYVCGGQLSSDGYCWDCGYDVGVVL